MIEANNQAEILTAKAINRVATSKLTSQALITEAEAEESASQNLINRRKQKERVKMAEGMTNLMSNSHVVMSGKQGDEFLNFFKDTIDLVNIKE